MKKPLEVLLNRIATIGADVHDDEEIRLQKSLLLICAFPFMVAGLAWGLMCSLFGETKAGLIPTSIPGDRQSGQPNS